MKVEHLRNDRQKIRRIGVIIIYLQVKMYLNCQSRDVFNHGRQMFLKTITFFNYLHSIQFTYYFKSSTVSHQQSTVTS